MRNVWGLLLGTWVFGMFCQHPLPATTKPAVRQAHEMGSDRYDRVVPGVVLLKFKPQVTVPTGTPARAADPLSQTLARHGVTSLSRRFPDVQSKRDVPASADNVGLSRIYRASINSSIDPAQIARQLSSLAGIEYAEPEFVHFPDSVPNDSLVVRGNQIATFTRLNAFSGWDIAKGNPSVVIAVVDGGTDWQHEDLLPNLRVNPGENGLDALGRDKRTNGVDDDGNGYVDDWRGWNFANNTNDPRGMPQTAESADHGTSTASMFGARTDNGVGMAGSAWNCSIMPVDVASPNLDGVFDYPFDGIVYAFRNGAAVINCSWGRVGSYSKFEQDVVDAATQSGALVVAAAGNGNGFVGYDADLIPHYPSNYRNVLGVGATNSVSDAIAEFSNYGLTVPVYAPGVSIVGALDGGGYQQAFMDGTSFSAPLVSGLAGILKSAHPAWTPRQIAAQIRVTADSIDAVNPDVAGKMGRGRVNFARALSESHAGIEILNATIRTTRGNSFLVQGDTISVTMTLKNILFRDAQDLTVSLTSSDPELVVLQGTGSVSFLGAGLQVTLNPFLFSVGPLASAKTVVIKAAWSSNTNEQDLYGLPIVLLPSTPLWNSQDVPSSTSLFSAKAASQNVVWASGGNELGTAPLVVRTTNGGMDWRVATGNLPPADLFCVFALDESRAWVGTGGGQIFATTDGGVSWSEQEYPGVQSPFIDAIYFADAVNGYALGDPPSGAPWVILRTTDGGQSWSHLANEPLGGPGEAGWNNSMCWTDLNHGWFGTNSGKVWRTTDGGATWFSSLSGGLSSLAVAFKDDLSGIVGHADGAVTGSTDGGITWNPVNKPATSGINAVAFSPGTTSAWLTDGSGIYRSVDDGRSWTRQSVYPFNGSIQYLTFADSAAGWGVTSAGGVLRYQIQTPTGVGQSPHFSPGSYALHQNFPNPFNPTTVISYEIAAISGQSLAPRGLEGSVVSLKIFDLLGREVAVLVDERKAPGRYIVNFDGTSLASGVYLYRLSAGAFVQTRKMIIVR